MQDCHVNFSAIDLVDRTIHPTGDGTAFCLDPPEPGLKWVEMSPSVRSRMALEERRSIRRAFVVRLDALEGDEQVRHEVRVVIDQPQKQFATVQASPVGSLPVGS